MKATAAIVIVIWALTGLPPMSAQVGRPNAPAPKPNDPPPKPPVRPPSRVDRGAPALRKLFNSFVQIPAGEFLTGSEWLGGDAKSVRVQISRLFEMGKYEVTQAQWKAAMGSNPSYYKKCGGACPVERVSWIDVQGFIKRLNALGDGYIYRLPTEAEWEYAWRADGSMLTGMVDTRAFDAMAWHSMNSGGKMHPVGQKQPNAWGLYDLHGNVREWCQDWYASSYDTQSPSVDPLGPSVGSERVIRGGDFRTDPEEMYRPIRGSSAPNDRGGDRPLAFGKEDMGSPSPLPPTGFRLVRTLR